MRISAWKSSVVPSGRVAVTVITCFGATIYSPIKEKLSSPVRPSDALDPPSLRELVRRQARVLP
jgi:hypothetical protein